MDRRMIFTALACASTAAFAANTVNPTFLWDGSADTTGRVITGSPEETSGYWFSYDDANDHGTSHFQFSPEFDMDTYDGFSFGLMAESFGGIKATVVLGEGYENPYVGFGFNIWNEDQESADITAWEGICLQYSSDLSFNVVVGIENEKTVSSYEDFAHIVPKTNSLTTVNLPWEDFSFFADSTTPSKAACIKLKFQEKTGTTGDFFLKKIGSYGQCSGSTDAIKPVANSQMNVSVSGRTVNFGRVAPSAKVSVMDLRGQVVKSATAAGTMDLSALPAGIYMLRVQGQNVNYIQRIILK